MIILIIIKSLQGFIQRRLRFYTKKAQVLYKEGSGFIQRRLRFYTKKAQV